VADRIGPFPFIRLDAPPDRVARHFEIARKSGINGVAIWDEGEAGEPFDVVSKAVALNFAQARLAFWQYKTLERTGPVQVYFGIAEPSQLYKVLRVKALTIKAVLRAHVANDATVYQGWIEAQWTLLPINPFITPP